MLYSGANYVGNYLRWGDLKMEEKVCNPKKKGGLFSRLWIAGEGFEPPTFGL